MNDNDRQDRAKWNGEWEKNNTSVSREMKKRTTTNNRILIITSVSRSEKIKTFPIQFPTRTTVTPTCAYPDLSEQSERCACARDVTPPPKGGR
jgi:hypothetical protein